MASQPLELASDVAARLGKIEGIVAVVLGGSHAQPDEAAQIYPQQSVTRAAPGARGRAGSEDCRCLGQGGRLVLEAADPLLEQRRQVFARYVLEDTLEICGRDHRVFVAP